MSVTMNTNTNTQTLSTTYSRYRAHRVNLRRYNELYLRNVRGIYQNGFLTLTEAAELAELAELAAWLHEVDTQSALREVTA